MMKKREREGKEIRVNKAKVYIREDTHVLTVGYEESDDVTWRLGHYSRRERRLNTSIFLGTDR